MANGLLDLLMQARESGRGARADLESSINYYIPPELRGLLGFAAEANPVVSMERAGQDAQRLVQLGLSGWDRMAAAGDMASNMAGVLAPMAAGRAVGMPAVRAAQEGLLGMSMTPEVAALRQFAGDEFGGIKAFQGGPHNFAAERLVRMPDGSTQYVVGAPDVLPNIPAGAEVLRDFPLGRQRMDKIGTGEGAQAYGHGLYFAENEGIARGYRDALAGTKVPSGDPVSNAWDMIHRLGGNDPQTREMIRQSFVDMAGDANPKTAEFARQSVEAIDSGAVDAFKAPGSMYEVNINANPNDFLDWDKPLSEQSQRVRDALAGLDVQAGNMTAKDRAETIGAALSGDPRLAHLLRDKTINTTGDTLYKGMADTLGSTDWPVGADAVTRQQFRTQGATKATEALREAGVPGIRYLDAGSRSTGGTSNYVMFDENLIDIVRKYGIAGAAAMLGASQADVAQAMQQQRPQGLLSGPQ